MSDFELCLISLFMVSLSVEGAVVTVSPQSVVAPIYTTATFTCEGTGNTLHWQVQSAPLTPDVQQERNITFTNPGGPGNLSSILTVPALPINDGIGIGCFIISNSSIIPAFSNSATLTVTGVSPVEDLQLNFTSNNSLHITWSRPDYYSNDIPVVATVSYNVLLTDDQGDVIVNKTITDTFIAVHNITECDTFNVSVAAIKAQYVSIDNTKKFNGSFSDTVHIEKNTQNSLKPIVTFNLNCPPSKCLSILTVTTDDEVIDEHLFTGSNITVSYTHKLLPSKEYTYIIKVMNLRNILKYKNFIIITTYQVSDVNIINQCTNGSVTVQCVFIMGSIADGCHVIFTDTTNGRNESFNITQPKKSKKVSLSTSGIYNVTVYDIVNGSLFGPAVQYPTLVVIFTTHVPYFLSATKSISTAIDSVYFETLFSELSLTISINPTITSSPAKNNIILILSTVSSAVIAVIVIISMITFTSFRLRKKRNEANKETMCTNPAYGEVLQVHHPSAQRSEFTTNINPAYETVHHHNAFFHAMYN